MRSSGGDRCVGTVASVMDSLGVTPEDIKDVQTTRRVNGNENNQHFQGYTIWTSLNSQQGYIVTYTRPNCRFLSVFSRGDITIADGKLVS